MEMNSRQVLATNHVNEIMLHWLDIGDWGQAFMKVIPKRKGGVLKSSKKSGEDDHTQDNENAVNEEREHEEERRANEAEDQPDEASSDRGEKNDEKQGGWLVGT